jgi:MFS transporter, SP family, sugar:H+ symporter
MTQECTPARYRGLMISAFQVWTSVGTLVGTVVDNFTSTIIGRNSYLIPLSLIYIVPAIMCVGLLFIPESPRWLLQHGKVEKATKSLRWLRPYGEAQVQQEINDMQEALASEIELSKHASIMEMFTNPIDRRRTLLAVGALSTQGASGAMYMIGRSPHPG